MAKTQWRTKGRGPNRKRFPISGSRERDWSGRIDDGYRAKPEEYKGIPRSQFADPDTYRYPIDKEHIHAALTYWARKPDRDFYTKEKQEEITRRIVEAALKQGVEVSYNPEYMKSLPESVKVKLKGYPPS